MKKSEALAAILAIQPEDIRQLNLEQLRDLLGSIRYVCRMTEREINQREIAEGLFINKKS